AARHAGAMLRLEVLALLALRLPLLALFASVAYGVSLIGGVLDQSLHRLLLEVGGFAVVAGVSWSMASGVIQYARCLRLNGDRAAPSGFAALAEALRLTLWTPGGLRGTALIAGVSAGGLAALILVGRLAAAPLDYALMVGTALLVRQVAAL